MSSIEIIKIPRGQAPEWVREAWIGLTLPLSDKSRQGMNIPSRSVRDSTVQMYEGYCVPALAAFEILKNRDRKAEEWWRRNTPLLYVSEKELVFDVEACKLVE